MGPLGLDPVHRWARSENRDHTYIYILLGANIIVQIQLNSISHTHTYIKETILFFRNLWLKKCVSCNSNARYNLNSYMCVIVIVF